MNVPRLCHRFAAALMLLATSLFMSQTASAEAVRFSAGEGAPVQIEAPDIMPSWFGADGPNADAWAALLALGDAASHGLVPRDYDAEGLMQAFETASQQHPAARERLETALTDAVVRFVADLNAGRLDPEVLRHRFKAPATPAFDARSHVLEMRLAGRLADALRGPRDPIPMYDALRSVMNQYRSLGDHPAWAARLPDLPRSLRPGDHWDGLPLLAARLHALGDLDEAGLASVTTQYEPPLVEAVQRFQERHGLDVDGVIGKGTLAEVNTSPAQRARQMALTLERLRWTPLLRAPRMIVVNIPEFILRAYEVRDRTVELDLEMRVVVGRALNTRTPIFLEDMRYIEFSPYWNVPSSIARSETLPRLRRDPGYFSREGFEFVTREGNVVTALSEEAIDAVQRGQWRIRQRPGPRNALGDIKFIFPNDQNIYLHHTPSTQLFSRARRDFSHGCIRVELPVELAAFVLKNQPEWTTERIEQAMTAERSRTVALREPIPVLLTYSTVVIKNGGKVYFFPDIYQQDARLEQALLKARPVRP